MELHAIGIDLGKTLFHLVGMDAQGNVVVRKRCSRKQLLVYTANLRVARIGMEACAGAHFLGRALRQQGHDVRLMPAQYVKPYVKSNKSDYIDAEAMAEAVERPNVRFVPIKTEEQLDLQAMHRVRECWAALTTIPGIGPVTATALVAAIGNASFRRGRDLAAWVGMVPREYSTGGKQRLLGISKRGNRYLRRLFVQGARVVMQYRHRQASGLSSWLSQLLSRAHQNVVIFPA